MEANNPIDLVSAALVECQAKLKVAEFDATNPFFSSRYATLGAVIEASRQPLAESGLAIQQIPTITDNSVTVHTIIRHKSGQWLDGGIMTLPIREPQPEPEPDDNETEWKKKKPGKQSAAQLAGSVVTYLKRYAWAANLGIYADEDDDGNSAPKGAQTRPAATQPPKPLAKADEATRMRALNFLQAAPGQPLRNLVQQFFVHKGWIKGEQNPEDWPLDKVPTGRHALTEIGNSVAMFERQQATQNDDTLPME